MSTAPSIQSCPVEIRECIYEYLDLESLQALSMTCPSFASDCWNNCCILDSIEWEDPSSFLAAISRTQKLRSLAIADSDFLDALPIALAQNHNLQVLYIQYCSHIELQSALPTSQSLAEMDILGCGYFSPQSLPIIINAAPSLRQLSMTASYQGTMLLDSLGSLKYLEKLSLTAQPQMPLLLAGIASKIGDNILWPHLRELTIEGIEDEACQVLFKISPSLRVLRVLRGLSVGCLSKLLGTLVEIEYLFLTSLDSLPLSVFEALCKNPPQALATVVLQNCFLPSDRELAPVFKLLPSLKALKLISCHQDEKAQPSSQPPFMTVSEQQKQHHAM